MKISSVGAESFLADGRTDAAELIVAFRNFANALKSLVFFISRETSPFFRVTSLAELQNVAQDIDMTQHVSYGRTECAVPERWNF